MAPDTDADGAAAAAALPEGCLPVLQWLRRRAVAEVAAGVAPGRQLLQQHLEERMWAFLRQAFLVPRDFPTIGEALAHAPRWPPTTILVSPGRYEEELVVDRPVTLIGDALGLPGGISGGSGGSASGGRAELWGGGGGATGGDRRRAAAVLFDVEPELPVAPQLRGFAVAAGGVHGAAAREVCSAVAVARGAATVVGCSLSSSTGYGLWAYATGRLKLVDSELDGRKAAALFEGESSGLVRNNRLEKCASFGILVQHTASPVLEGNVFRGVKKAAVYVKDFAEPCVRECRFEANESSGIFVCESACPVVEKNEFRGHTMPAIMVKDRASGLVRGNVIEGNLGIAVLLAGSTTVVLEGNDLRDNRKKSGTPASQQRIQAQSQALRVLRELEPEISSTRGGKRAAILVQDQAAPIVRGNSLSSNDGYGILVCNSANPTVEGNTVRNHWRPGIAIRDTASCLLRKNSLFDNEGYGVMVGEDACPQIEERSGGIPRYFLKAPCRIEGERVQRPQKTRGGVARWLHARPSARERLQRQRRLRRRRRRNGAADHRRQHLPGRRSAGDRRAGRRSRAHPRQHHRQPRSDLHRTPGTSCTVRGRQHPLCRTGPCRGRLCRFRRCRAPCADRLQG